MDITDFTYGIAGNLFDIDPCAGGDLTADQHHTGFNVGFAGHARFGILLEDGVQHGVRNLVGDFIRMSF